MVEKTFEPPSLPLSLCSFLGLVTRSLVVADRRLIITIVSIMVKLDKGSGTLRFEFNL